MAEECSTRHLPVASTYADAVLYLWVYDRELKDQPHRRIAASPHRRRCRPSARYGLTTSGQTPA
jgi:hypothetical protein